MAVVAKVAVEQTRLLCQERTICHCELVNNTRGELRGVNPGGWPGYPTLVLTRVGDAAEQRFVRKQPDTPDQFAPSLGPGKSFSESFPLATVVDAARPGTYELRAVYEWQGGAFRAASEPVRIEFLPVEPIAVRTAWLRASPGAHAAAVWLNPPTAANAPFSIWVSKIATALKPRVTDVVQVAEVRQRVQPSLSIPPNAAATFLWVAWVDGTELQYVLHGNDEVSAVETVKLPAAGYRIVPPLLEMPPVRGALASRLDVLLVRGEPSDGAWGLRRLTLRISGGAVTQDEVEFKGQPPAWIETAFLSDGRCRTFALERVDGGAILRLSRWSGLRPPESFTELGEFGGRLISATLTQTEEDVVCGAALFDAGEGSTPYVLRRWYLMPNDDFALQDERPVSWTERDPIDSAVIRVAMDSAPFALLRSGGRESGWFFCHNDGRVSALNCAPLRPVDVLFRMGRDPTILAVDPGRGLSFLRP